MTYLKIIEISKDEFMKGVKDCKGFDFWDTKMCDSGAYPVSEKETYAFSKNNEIVIPCGNNEEDK